MMSKVHKLKVSEKHWYKYLEKVSWSIRSNDRDFQCHDICEFKVVKDSGLYHSITCVLKLVTGVLKHEEFPAGIQPGYCILTLELIKAY